LAAQSNSVGVYTLSGGALSIAGGLIVGSSGTGTLNITGSGFASSGNEAFIGRFTGSKGTATVDGPGSKFETVGGLKVGHEGTGTLRVQNGGVVSASGGVSVNNALSQVTGDGTIVSNLTNHGTISPGLVTPGNSTGTLHIAGDFSQGVLRPDLGKLKIELASPTKFDKLDITGNVALGGGTLEVSLTGGYVPQGVQFDILDWGGSLIGTFASVQLPTLGGLISWDTSQLYTNGVISVSGPPSNLAGDYNKNGVVDAADYVVWRNSLGQAGAGLAADGNRNNQIDAGDYDLWRAKFGQTAGNGSAIPSAETLSAAVPEPASIALLLSVLAALALNRCTRNAKVS
jgi:T5SS/PEP-CTERM-associated repeat protein